MKDLLLSPHFKLAEFERSATATKLGIDNHVPSQYIPALQQLCKEILEPLRAFINSSTPPHKGEEEGVVITSSPLSSIIIFFIPCVIYSFLW